MIKWLKLAYNRWLFKKYGFDRGVFFERIPLLFKLSPLWSPSLYGHCEGSQICEWFRQGMEEEMSYRERQTD